MLHSTSYHTLMEKIVSIYNECNIQTFPVDCYSIILHYGFRIYTYEELKKQNRRVYELVSSYSRDSFTFDDIIAYNEKQSKSRIPFSLMHELGHYMLGHEGDSIENEDEANEFASNFLAPRILIHKHGYRTSVEIHDAFGLSYAASNRALFSYKEWLWSISRSRPRTPSEPELQLEKIFFPPEIEKLPEPVIEEEEQEERPIDSAEKYLMILRIINMGIPVPPEYKKNVQWYKRNGFRLK